MVDQVRSFVFTYNNYQPDTIENIRDRLKFRYLIIGKEIGESGTPHLQGFCQLQFRMRFRRLGSLFPWHIEPTLGTPSEARDYCKKDGNFEEWGQISTVSNNGQRTKDRWQSILKMAQGGLWENLQLEYPGEYVRNLRQLKQVHVDTMVPVSCNVRCLWLYGSPRTGKSRFAFDFDKNAYPKNCNKWWDNYQGNESVIIDDFDKTHSVLGYHIKRWADRYPLLAETKGSSLYPHYNTIIVTSNYRPDEIWEDKMMSWAITDRFKLVHVVGHEESLEGILSIKTPGPGLNYTYLTKFNVFD